MQKQETLKNRRLTLKSELDDKEAELGEIRKRLQVQQREIAQVQKGVTALETKLEQKRADRHSLLKSCKVSEG
jgi:structural maintenance of chromosome 1